MATRRRTARSFASLTKHFHVYAVDALFHGYSSKEGFELGSTFDLLADGFVDLVQALGYDKVHFEGESMGGMFGINVGFRYPEYVDKMINNSGFYRFKMSRDDFPPSKHVFEGDLPELSVKAITEPTLDNIRRRLEWLVAKPEYMPEEMVHIRQTLYSDPEINASMRRVFNVGGPFGGLVADWPYTEEDLRNFPVETLVIWGEFNPGQGAEFGEYCAQVMGAKFYEVKGAGHWPQWEKPEEYCQAIIEFLQT